MSTVYRLVQPSFMTSGVREPTDPCPGIGERGKGGEIGLKQNISNDLRRNNLIY